MAARAKSRRAICEPMAICSSRNQRLVYQGTVIANQSDGKLPPKDEQDHAGDQTTMRRVDGFHEDFSRAGPDGKSSDRSFGIVFAVAFSIIALWPLWSREPVRLWGLIVAAVFLGTAVIRPQMLALPNRLWLRFGALLHGIVSPIAMGVVFYLTVTPVGMLMRLLGKRPIPLRFDRDKGSYWIERDPPGPTPDSIKNQF